MFFLVFFCIWRLHVFLVLCVSDNLSFSIPFMSETVLLLLLKCLCEWWQSFMCAFMLFLLPFLFLCLMSDMSIVAPSVYLGMSSWEQWQGMVLIQSFLSLLALQSFKFFSKWYIYLLWKHCKNKNVRKCWRSLGSIPKTAFF